MTTNINPQLIKEFLSTLPSQIQNFNQQLMQDLQPKLEQWLASLNLVSKAEFDQQAKKLTHAQQELDQIKQTLHTIQKKLSHGQLSPKCALELENSNNCSQ